MTKSLQILNLANNFGVIFLTSLSFLLCHKTIIADSESCQNGNFVYGRSEIIDQIIICSLAKANDLDLTPQRGHAKLTSRAFVELGFSNKTDIVSAKLSGLWTAKRADYAQTTWHCDPKTITMSTIIEINGLALDVIERVDISLSRKGTKGPTYKPCKSFNLPTSLCRQTKTIYKNTRTWVNQAFFNITLVQDHNLSTKPEIKDLWLMFTCPETFRHKITYSPSASYVLTKHSQQIVDQLNPTSARSSQTKKRTLEHERNLENHVPIPHPILQGSTHDGRGPVAAPYQKSVNTILSRTIDSISKTIGECVLRVDSDLSMLADHVSFTNEKYPDDKSTHRERRELNRSTLGHCSSKSWLMQRSELAINGHSTQLMSSASTSIKRTLGNHNRSDQNESYELLDPYGYYHDEKMTMIVNDNKIDDITKQINNI